VHLINFSGGGQVIALKSATALILDRCPQYVFRTYAENFFYFFCKKLSKSYNQNLKPNFARKTFLGKFSVNTKTGTKLCLEILLGKILGEYKI
jgi:hypothetical protein